MEAATISRDEGFETIALETGHRLQAGWLPEALLPDEGAFEELWRLHPDDYLRLRIHGRWVDTPRWTRSYGRDYVYSRQRAQAHPMDPLLIPYLEWARTHIDSRLDGVLLNWYDGRLGHRISAHRDSTEGLAPDSPIVTLSLGESRTFRLRRHRQKGCDFRDLIAANGRVFVMPLETNAVWTHEVPTFVKQRGRRISITLRVFR